MKILIAYSTKSGTTAKCAAMLSKELTSHSVTLADLSESFPDPEGYDFVAVGGPVRFGKLHKKTAEYLDVNKEKLKTLRAGYFIVCGFVDSADEYIEKLFPAELRQNAVISACFGGELNTKKMKGFDKFITKLIIKVVTDEGKSDGELPARSLPEIHPDSISRFADAIKASFA
ncbi:MAG: flavodoxin domain-containing protein [Eubacteriales bacterium]|jgi:menaquinone-dependent protoporphyrinogen oxidase